MDGGLNATPGTICGLDYMRDPKLNKGSSFTIEERQTLGIHGLLPPRVKTQEEQAGHSMRNLRRLSDPLNQYMYMVSDITPSSPYPLPVKDIPLEEKYSLLLPATPDTVVNEPLSTD